MNSKKGIQLSQAFGAVLTLVLVAVLVIVAIVIFVSLATSFAGTSSVTVINETGAFVNITGYTVDDAGACSFGDALATEVWGNVSGTPFVIPAANYTLTSTTGILTNATVVPNATQYNDATISYTYTFGSAACDASESMVTEFSNYTSLIGLVGTIIFLGLVIGILVVAFAFGGRRET